MRSLNIVIQGEIHLHKLIRPVAHRTLRLGTTSSMEAPSHLQLW